MSLIHHYDTLKPSDFEERDKIRANAPPTVGLIFEGFAIKATQHNALKRTRCHLMLPVKLEHMPGSPLR